MPYKPVDFVEGVLDAVCRVHGIGADGSETSRLRAEDMLYSAFARRVMEGHPAFHKLYFDRAHPITDDTGRSGEKQINTVRLPAQFSYMKPVVVDE